MPINTPFPTSARWKRCVPRGVPIAPQKLDVHLGQDCFKPFVHRHYGSPHSARRTSRDAMIFPSSGISFPSPALRLGERLIADSSPPDGSDERKTFVSQSNAKEVAGPWRPLFNFH
jgi:hypothetical protein